MPSDNEQPAEEPNDAPDEPVEVAGVIWDKNAPNGFPVGRQDYVGPRRNTD